MRRNFVFIGGMASAMAFFACTAALPAPANTGGTTDQLAAWHSMLDKSDADPRLLDKAIFEMEARRTGKFLKQDGLLLLARAHYMKGCSKQPELLDNLKTCRQYADEIIAKDEKNIEALYLASVSRLHIAQQVPKFQALFLAREAMSSLQKTIDIGGGAMESAAPYRLLGRIFYESPPPPFFGNKKKAVEYLEKARDLAPASTLNRYYLSEAYIAVGKQDEAIEELNWIVQVKPGPTHSKDDRDAIEEARQLLAKLAHP